MDDKEFEELKARFEAAMQRGRNEYFDIDDLIDIVDNYIYDERDEDAEKAIRFALRLYPDNAEMLLLRARLFLCHDDFDSAAAIIAKLPTTCDVPDYSLICGELLLREGHIDEAQMRYERALLLSGNGPEVYASAINAFDTYDHPSEADEWMQRGIRRWPDDLGIIEAAALCHSLNNRHKEAIELANRFVDADPYNIRAWYLLGDVCHDACDYSGAIDAYGYVLALKPDDTTCDRNRADCHFALGDFATARDLYARALDLGNDETDYTLGRLALCEANLGNDQEFIRLTRILRNRDLN